MFPRLWRLLRPFHSTFYTLVALAVIYEVSSLVSSYTVSLIVRLFDLQAQLVIWVLVLGIAVIHGELSMRLDNKFDWHIIAKQSHEIYPFLKLAAVAKFLKLPASWHQLRNSGAMIGQVSDGVWKALEVIEVISWEIITTSIQMVISLVPIFYYSPIIGISLVLVFLIFIKITLDGEKKKYIFRRRRQALYHQEWGLGTQIVQGWETVVLFGQQNHLMSQLKKIHDKIIKLAHLEHKIGIYKYNRVRIRLNINARLAFYTILVIQLYLGAIDVPSMIFISVLVERLLSNFWRFTRLIDRIYSNSQGVTQLLDLLDQKEAGLGGSVIKPKSLPVAISFQDVCFGYTNSTNKGALHKLNLEIEAGKVTALVGPSGAGKTTVPRLILGLWQPSKGKIIIGGERHEDWNLESLRKLVAYVPQGDSVYLWDTTIGKNIGFPDPSAPFEKTVAAAKLAGIHDFIMTQPKGYNTRVGEHGVRLSGGQKQRVALARAIFVGSPVLVLDEATSAVDALTEEEIKNNLTSVQDGKTVLVIAHRLSTIYDADKIVVLCKGRKVEEGKHKQLIKLKGLYARMVALQSK